MKLSYSQEAKKAIRYFPPESKRGLRLVFDALQKNPGLGKPLQKELFGFWSMPYKRYRIIYKEFLDEDKIIIYAIDKRADIYKTFNPHQFHLKT